MACRTTRPLVYDLATLREHNRSVISGQGVFFPPQNAFPGSRTPSLPASLEPSRPRETSAETHTQPNSKGAADKSKASLPHLSPTPSARQSLASRRFRRDHNWAFPKGPPGEPQGSDVQSQIRSQIQETLADRLAGHSPHPAKTHRRSELQDTDCQDRTHRSREALPLP